MRSTVRFILALLCVPAFGVVRPAQAQWSLAPSVALGTAVPAGAFSRDVAESVTLKGALWLRAPRVPVGLTLEGMYAQFRDARPDVASENTHVGAVLANVTTRRHERKLELYGVAGAGWYWRNGPTDSFAERQAPGINFGVGEIIALGRRDFFVELRLHAVRTPARTGEQWMTFMPLLIGARF
jgi:hypothetical protein